MTKNWGHSAKLVGSGVSRAALSNCGNRAQVKLGRHALARTSASTAVRGVWLVRQKRSFTMDEIQQASAD